MKSPHFYIVPKSVRDEIARIAVNEDWLLWIPIDARGDRYGVLREWGNNAYAVQQYDRGTRQYLNSRYLQTQDEIEAQQYWVDTVREWIKISRANENLS